MPLYPINDSSGGTSAPAAPTPVVVLGPPAPAATPTPTAATIAAAADLYAQQQDRLAAERDARKAIADRNRAIADANRTALQMRADTAAFSTGAPPVWIVPVLLVGGGALALFFHFNRSKRRR
jgi:hypothetical protein